LEKQVENNQMTGLMNAKRLQKQRIKHVSICSSEATPELQLTSIEKHDEKKNVHKRKKKQYENNQTEKLEELGQQHQTRKFYRDIKKLRKAFKLRLTI